MTIQNLKPQVVSIPRPSIVSISEETGQKSYMSTGHVVLVPGMNAISPDDAAWLAKHPGIKRRIASGALKIHDGESDPLSGSVEKVVAGVAETFDRPTLEALRQKDSRKQVREAIDAQLEKLTDHRTKGAA